MKLEGKVAIVTGSSLGIGSGNALKQTILHREFLPANVYSEQAVAKELVFLKKNTTGHSSVVWLR